MSFIVTVAAASGAIFAAWYTSKAVEEARKQNDIARFEKLTGIYHALNNFKGAIKDIVPEHSFTEAITDIRPEYPENALREFEIAALLSEFYFSRKISSEFARISKIAVKNRQLYKQSTRGRVDLPSLLRNVPGSQNVLAKIANKKLLNDCTNLSEDVRLYLANLASPVN